MWTPALAVQGRRLDTVRASAPVRRSAAPSHGQDPAALRGGPRRLRAPSDSARWSWGSQGSGRGRRKGPSFAPLRSEQKLAVPSRGWPAALTLTAGA